jgi:tetratricopeptide (TPR) repeat protein
MTTPDESETEFDPERLAAAEQIDAVDRRLVRWLGFVLVLVTLLVFRHVGEFKLLTWDDDQHILENPYYNPLTLKNLLHFWGYSYIYLYIPVSYTFFGAEVAIARWLPSGDPTDKLNPAVFHLGNLLVHLGCVLLVYRLLLRLVRHAPAAFLGTLLFAIHPLQVESVCWVGETRGTLAALFSLLALLRYLDYVGVDPDRGLFVERAYMLPQRRRADYVWATVYFALALLSKPSAASLPLVVAIVDVVLLRQRWQDAARRLAPWFVMAAAITGLTKYYQKTDLMYRPAVPPVIERPLVAGDAYTFYLRKLVWPSDLAFDYGRTPEAAAASPGYHWAWLVPVGLVAILLLLRQRGRVGLGAFAWFLAALAPVSGLVPFLYQSISTVADRYMYVPLIGLGLGLAAWTATRRRSGLVFIAAVPIFVLLALRSSEQTLFWRDDGVVYVQGLRVNPQSFMAHLHIGNNQRRAKDFAGALDSYRRMLAVRPSYYTTHTLIAQSLFDLGRTAEAEEEFRRTLAVDSKNVEALCGLARALQADGKTDEAVAELRRAVECDSKAQLPLLLLGEMLTDRPADAERAFAAALELDDRSAEAHLRYGLFLSAREELPAAIREFGRAVELDPQSTAARYELATALYRQGKFARAIEEAEAALRLQPNDFGPLQTLGLAQVAVGRNTDAAATFEKALKLAPPASPQATAVRTALGALQK